VELLLVAMQVGNEKKGATYLPTYLPTFPPTFPPTFLPLLRFELNAGSPSPESRRSPPGIIEKLNREMRKSRHSTAIQRDTIMRDRLLHSMITVAVAAASSAFTSMSITQTSAASVAAPTAANPLGRTRSAGNLG
jgi:hypothetical protein